MSPDAWLSALAAELRRHGVPGAAAASVAGDVRAYLADSGEGPVAAFGPPERYAAEVAESLHTGPDGTGPDRTATPGPVLLRATGITKRYGRRRVLDGVDLTVRAGQIAAIVGANGCGKSTLLRICAGLLSPDAGEVVLAGPAAYCPQDGGTAGFLTADEHFVLVGAGRGLSRTRARDAGRAWARGLGWTDAGTAPARHLSGGTRQKLNLVCSALTEPAILLLDEPYQGFDRGAYVNLWDRLWRLRDEGRAIVVVTHLLNPLDRVDVVCDLTGTVAA